MAERRFPGLPGCRILIVEDEVLVAMDLEDTFREQGCDVVAVVSTVESALAAVDALHPQVAVLDLNLDGEPTFAVAEKLGEAAIPFVIVSGYGELRAAEPLLANAPLVEKPWNRDTLLSRVEGLRTAHAGTDPSATPRQPKARTPG